MIQVANIPTESYEDNGYRVWYPHINKPFPFGDKGLHIGLSSAWLREATINGVSKIMYVWNGKNYYWFLPDKKMLSKMKRDRDYKEEVINYDNCPLKLYFFKL